MRATKNGSRDDESSASTKVPEVMSQTRVAYLNNI